MGGQEQKPPAQLLVGGGEEPVRFKRRGALLGRDKVTLAEVQRDELLEFLRRVIDAHPLIHTWVEGVPRCPTFPDCDHAGCKVLVDLQRGARAVVERQELEISHPAEALRRAVDDDARIEEVFNHLDEMRAVNRSAE